tara:strand:- start:3247 stop:3420 length:174 start_codon:yes stop_codon:yes gene_type:complete
MLIVKKEYLQEKPRAGCKLALGDMNQNQLQSIKEKQGDKWFETKEIKKKKKKDDVEN